MLFARGAFEVRRFYGAATQQTPEEDCVARGRYCLFTTTRRAGFRNSNWALTFSICAACSFTVAARRATVLSNSAILFCCFWNSLSFAWGWAPLGLRILTFFPLALTRLVPK
jgi:hypothetical protein